MVMVKSDLHVICRNFCHSRDTAGKIASGKGPADQGQTGALTGAFESLGTRISKPHLPFLFYACIIRHSGETGFAAIL